MRGGVLTSSSAAVVVMVGVRTRMLIDESEGMVGWNGGVVRELEYGRGKKMGEVFLSAFYTRLLWANFAIEANDCCAIHPLCGIRLAGYV